MRHHVVLLFVSFKRIMAVFQLNLFLLAQAVDGEVAVAVAEENNDLVIYKSLII